MVEAWEEEDGGRWLVVADAGEEAGGEEAETKMRRLHVFQIGKIKEGTESVKKGAVDFINVNIWDCKFNQQASAHMLTNWPGTDRTPKSCICVFFSSKKIASP